MTYVKEEDVGPDKIRFIYLHFSSKQDFHVVVIHTYTAQNGKC
jgi:hypothetical protein